MKTRNFPLKKLRRQCRAQGRVPKPEEVQMARAKRTKKIRRPTGIAA